MAQFKSDEVKKVGKVQISARTLKELAEKLENVRGTVGNVEVDLYLIPNKEDESKVSQIAFDFSEEIVPEVKPEEKPVEDPKKEEKPIEQPAIETKEKPAESVATEDPKKETIISIEENKETQKPEVVVEDPKKEEKPASSVLTDEEIVAKAKEIQEKVDKGLNPEEK